MSLLLTLGMVVLAFSLIVLGPAGTRRAAGGASRLLSAGLLHALRFTIGGILLITFTAIDAVITTLLVVYQTATVRPYLVGDAWAAFFTRLNDRLLKVIWH